MSQCRGQRYDGASKVAWRKTGVATRMQQKQPKAVLTHCYGHALNFAVSDCIKRSTVCHHALDVAFEIAKLITFSPKRKASFNRIRVESSTNEDASGYGFRSLCPTRWTVRVDALESIIDLWTTLNRLWVECLKLAYMQS